MDRIEFLGPRAVVYGDRGVSLAELAPIVGAFKDLSPEMTVAEVTAVLGPPTARAGGSETPLAEFERPQGRIRVALEKDASEGLVFARWRLILIPEDRSLRPTLHPEVFRIIRSRLDRTTEVVIMTPGVQGPRMEFKIDGDGVSQIEWLE